MVLPRAYGEPDGDAGGGGKLVNQKTYTETDYIAGSVAIPYDDTIPDIGEGIEVMTTAGDAYTPADAANIIHVTVYANGYYDSRATIALFKDGASQSISSVQGWSVCTPFFAEFTAGSTSPFNLTVRAGNNAGTQIEFNGKAFSSAVYGGVSISAIIIKEYLP